MTKLDELKEMYYTAMQNHIAHCKSGLSGVAASYEKVKLIEKQIHEIEPPTFRYNEIKQSMLESIRDHEMRFTEAWDYECEAAWRIHGRNAREIMWAERKTLAMLLSELEDLGVINTSNLYNQPYDLDLERELGNPY